ncbi:MAG: SulP family inorganic anion transporter [Planctomycetota bacterium]
MLSDLSAGVIVGIVALPLAIAFAIASGVKPEQGLYTAVIAGFVISVLSGSRVQIGGPTGAFIVIVYGIVREHGYEGLAIATVMAGGLLILMGLARLGSVIRFVPYPVTIGFTAGIALIIAASQLPDLLGLHVPDMPADFLGKLAACTENLTTVNPWSIGGGLLTVAIITLWPRLTHRIPGSLVAIVVTTALVPLFDLPLETIGTRFGSVPSQFPSPSLPSFDLADVRELFPSALTIALLAAIESLLCATVADGMIGTRHRSNMELIAQGAANILSPLFGGIPATGAIARTATNIKNGGRTPIAGMTHAVVLLLIMLFFGSWAARIPICTLAGILLVVAYHMSEWRVFARLFRSPRSDVLVLMTTFLLTVLIDLTVALEAGIILACFLFMRRMATLSQAGYITRMLQEEEEEDDPSAIGTRQVPDGVEVFEIYGTFFFGAASKFHEAIDRIERTPKVLILRLREVPAIDATGLRALEDLIDKTKRQGTALLLSGLHAQPLEALQKAGLFERIGKANAHPDIDHALDHARKIVGLESL